MSQFQEPMTVTLYAKRDCADVTELGILRSEGYPGASGWAQCNHKFL